MTRFSETLREAGLKFTQETAEDGLEIFVVQAHEDYSEFLALIFPTEEGAHFLRLVFFLDRIRADDPFSQYERLLELNRESWMGAYAVDTTTSAVIYVFNFPLAEFDASALMVTQETFRLARQLYTDAMAGTEDDAEAGSGAKARPADEGKE